MSAANCTSFGEGVGLSASSWVMSSLISARTSLRADRPRSVPYSESSSAAYAQGGARAAAGGPAGGCVHATMAAHCHLVQRTARWLWRANSNTHQLEQCAGKAAPLTLMSSALMVSLALTTTNVPMSLPCGACWDR